MKHQDFEKYAEQRLMDGFVPIRYKKFFEEKIGYNNPNLKILDFGCGDGKMFNWFKQFIKEENIYGLDISKTRIRRCEKIGWKNVLRIDKLKRLPFGDNFFDVVSLCEVIEHIPKTEISFYLKEFRRILKKDGKLIITTPNYPIKRLYDFLFIFLKKKLRYLTDDPTHVCLYNFDRLEKALNPYFIEIEIEPTGGFFHKLIKNNFFSHKLIGVCKQKKET